ncbi:hypothetical protein CALVIDRAFT_190172 [Calocera viscosa TUFC12733]|uniref:Uncharacterized protein n=1 Tax=Calocera viscosa (strain TUFC12733) TaxID=1330018 RepID=A0A167KMA6_CALVF|nr:hypothetical protein CALVIDRAFT_190172 [Calocera viscosa TUFC12733]
MKGHILQQEPLANILDGMTTALPILVHVPNTDLFYPARCICQPLEARSAARHLERDAVLTVCDLMGFILARISGCGFSALRLWENGRCFDPSVWSGLGDESSIFLSLPNRRTSSYLLCADHQHVLPHSLLSSNSRLGPLRHTLSETQCVPCAALRAFILGGHQDAGSLHCVFGRTVGVWTFRCGAVRVTNPPFSFLFPSRCTASYLLRADHQLVLPHRCLPATQGPVHFHAP